MGFNGEKCSPTSGLLIAALCKGPQLNGLIITSRTSEIQGHDQVWCARHRCPRIPSRNNWHDTNLDCAFVNNALVFRCSKRWDGEGGRLGPSLLYLTSVRWGWIFLVWSGPRLFGCGWGSRACCTPCLEGSGSWDRVQASRCRLTGPPSLRCYIHLGSALTKSKVQVWKEKKIVPWVNLSHMSLAHVMNLEVKFVS